MSESDPKSAPAPAAPPAAGSAQALKTLALKTLTFLAALAASLVAAQVVFGVLGLPLKLGEMRLDAAGWITALMILMTTRPRSARHWGLVAGSILAVIFAATLGAALGELLLHHGVVAGLGGLGELAVRICALLVLWGPALLVFARLLYSAGFVVEAWESERPKDAQSEI